MNNTNYDVNFFINKTKAIPEDKWISFQLYDDKGACCINGHCGVRSNNEADCFGKQTHNFLHTPESIALNKLFVNYLKVEAYVVNDTKTDEFDQSSPKERIISALYKIKELVESTYPKVKEVIRYVSVSESLKKQTKELIEN